MANDTKGAQNSQGSEDAQNPKDSKEEKGKDNWEKADVVLKFIAGVFTAAAVAFIGFYGSYTLERNQALDTDTRLYAELMSQRENAETSLRKDMFNSIIGSFLKSKSAGYEEKVLNLELLAYNFHEALDLGPLFKSVYAEIRESRKPNADLYLRRLEDAADEVKSKQIMSLEDSGGKLDATVDFGELKLDEGKTIELMSGPLNFRPTESEQNRMLQNTTFKVDVLAVEQDQRRIRIKLEVKTPRTVAATATPNANTADANVETDTTYAVFWISPFDFPMIDNTRLPHGQRCALVLRKMGQDRAELTLVSFPGSRASLKEKPFFDEAMSDLLQIRRRLDK
jgi:hypothetical protein